MTVVHPQETELFIFPPLFFPSDSVRPGCWNGDRRRKKGSRGFHTAKHPKQPRNHPNPTAHTSAAREQPTVWPAEAVMFVWWR